jgi:hypothetical protein
VTLTGLAEELQASLHDAAQVFSSADYLRLIGLAVLDYSRPSRSGGVSRAARQTLDSIELTAGVSLYDPPRQDYLMVGVCQWGRLQRRQRSPWEANYPKNLPVIDLVYAGDAQKLRLSRAPTNLEITDFGSACAYTGYRRHVISDSESSVPDTDKDLLLLRAQAEAMRELAMRGMTKPVALRSGGAGASVANGTPAALYTALLEEFERRMA